MTSYAYSQFQCVDPDLICDSCVCPAIYDPVMGCDGEIYGNSCEAYINGITAWIPYLASEFVNIDAPSQINKGESATLLIEHKDVSPAVVTYDWDHGDNGKEIVVKPDSSTTYRVKITVIYGFSFEDGSVFTYTDENTYDLYLEVKDPLGEVNFTSNRNKLNIFPNPAYHEVNIISDNTINLIQILDTKGVTLKNLIVKKNNATIDISDLYPGIYFLKIHENDAVVLKIIRIE